MRGSDKDWVNLFNSSCVSCRAKRGLSKGMTGSVTAMDFEGIGGRGLEVLRLISVGTVRGGIHNHRANDKAGVRCIVVGLKE